MNICVFCSAQDVSEEYTEAAECFGRLLGERGHTLVWGGSDRGLMRAVARGVKDSGGKLIAISMELVKHKVHKNADETIIAKTLGERKALMLERSDAVIALPGGMGTLDEITEILALKRHGVHDKIALVLNTANFYGGLKTQLETMDHAGFFANLDNDVVEGLSRIVEFADTPEDAMRYIEAHGH